MRTDFSLALTADRGDQSAPSSPSEVLDTLVVMRWDLSNALHEAALSDVPDVAIERLRRVKTELDLSIAAWKTLVDKPGLTR